MSGPATILAIDDEPGVRATFAAILREVGDHTLEDEDGVAGLARVRAGAPDLVLCDEPVSAPEAFQE